MENKKSVSELMGITMEKVKEMVDINSIIGEPIKVDDNITIIPISKVSFGFASGGSDLPNKLSRDLFGGGAGAGVSIKPEGFLVINNGEVKMISSSVSSDPVSSAISAVPGVIDKISGFINKKKNGENTDASDTDELREILDDTSEFDG